MRVATEAGITEVGSDPPRRLGIKYTVALIEFKVSPLGRGGCYSVLPGVI